MLRCEIFYSQKLFINFFIIYKNVLLSLQFGSRAMDGRAERIRREEHEDLVSALLCLVNRLTGAFCDLASHNRSYV